MASELPDYRQDRISGIRSTYCFDFLDESADDSQIDLFLALHWISVDVFMGSVFV